MPGLFGISLQFKLETVMKCKNLLLTIVFFAITSTAQAHTVWINAFESHAHQPPHAIITLGWGHTLPLDDILTSPNGRVAIETLEVLDPKLVSTNLIKPVFKLSKPDLTTGNFDLYGADMGVQKIAFKKDSMEGVYQIAAISKAAFYTTFIDKKGNNRFKLKPKNEIKNVQKVLMSVKYQAFAKSYVTLGTWSQPQPIGHGLEIIPRTDLSNLHVGDLVEVTVLFYGKPVTATAKSIEYITAASSSFGQIDGFSLMSYIIDGKAQFRVQSAGQWIVSTNHKDDVTPDGPMKDLYGKADHVYQGASLTFMVK